LSRSLLLAEMLHTRHECFLPIKARDPFKESRSTEYPLTINDQLPIYHLGLAENIDGPNGLDPYRIR